MAELQIQQLENTIQAKEVMRDIGVSAYGIEHMAAKLIFRVVRLNGISSKAANILKQEMLSIGGEVAVAYGVCAFDPQPSDCLVAGTLRQFDRLIAKLRMQPFGLKKVAEQLTDALTTK